VSRKPPDFDLWLDVAQSVKPLRHRPSKQINANAPPLRPAERQPVLVRPSQPHGHALSHPGKSPPQITGFDRRTAQRFTRGQVELERRLDLHGTGIEMARVRLMQFLREAQAEGLRTVLVITGKGDSPFSRHTLHGREHYDAPERQGRLRRLVPEWFHDSAFRMYVAGYQPAHPKHGGGGAFYVKIRRLRAGQ
jgi:DNA-nicking Smr family endonuclease